MLCSAVNAKSGTAPGGNPGTSGGKAGKSGKGGSGAGGPSFAVVTVGSVIYEAIGSTMAHGKGGQGADGAPAGAEGDIGVF